MLSWLVGVGVFLLLWGALWKSSPRAAFGVMWGFLIALILAWLFSQQLTNYITGMNEIPIWLPPLPFALVVITLFYFGIRTWLNADKLPPPRERESDAHGNEGHH